MPKVKAGTLELYYETGGSGPPVLFISGTGGDLRVRPNSTEGPLARSFTVLAYDQRGLGQSDIPPGPYSMADYADDAAALLDAVGWDRAAVVGASFGGMVAQELVLRHPDRVSRLVLACTSSGGDGGASYPLHELLDMDGAERAVRTIGLADTRMDSNWQEQNPEEWDRMVQLRVQMASVGAEEPERERGAALQLEARRFHDTWERLPTVACPTLVCAGRYDGIAPLANSERLVAAIPGAELEVFEGGHLFLLQVPKSYEVIRGFLGG